MNARLLDLDIRGVAETDIDGVTVTVLVGNGQTRWSCSEHGLTHATACHHTVQAAATIAAPLLGVAVEVHATPN